MRIILISIIMSLGLHVQAQWQLLSLGPNTEDYKVQDLYFLNDSVGFAACWISQASTGAIFKTTDGALTWTKVLESTAMESITFISADTGYAVGAFGNVFRTIDGGDSWPLLNNLAPWWDLRSIYFKPNGESFIGSGEGFYLGDCPTPFLHSNDGWITWDSIMINNNNLVVPNAQVLNFYFLNNDTGFAVSDDNVFRTFDGGSTWYANLDIGNFQLSSFTQVFKNPFDSILYLTGRAYNSGDNQWGAAYKSIDLGDSWIEYQFTPIDYGFDTMAWVHDGQFVSPMVGYMVGGHKPWSSSAGDAGIARTTDGGLTWQDDYVGGNNASVFFSIHCPTPQTCYCGGYNGVIMKNSHADSVETSVGIIPDRKSSFSIYPNPSADNFNISYKISSPSRCIISDLNGRVVKQFQLYPSQTKATIPTNDLVDGMYVVEIKSEGKTERCKLVIMH